MQPPRLRVGKLLMLLKSLAGQQVRLGELVFISVDVVVQKFPRKNGRGISRKVCCIQGLDMCFVGLVGGTLPLS